MSEEDTGIADLKDFMSTDIRKWLRKKKMEAAAAVAARLAALAPGTLPAVSQVQPPPPPPPTVPVPEQRPAAVTRSDRRCCSPRS